MKCPGCQYVSGDSRDLCPKCLLDLRAYKDVMGLRVSHPDLSYSELLKKVSGRSQKTKKTSLFSKIKKILGNEDNKSKKESKKSKATLKPSDDTSTKKVKKKKFSSVKTAPEEKIEETVLHVKTRINNENQEEVLKENLDPETVERRAFVKSLFMPRVKDSKPIEESTEEVKISAPETEHSQITREEETAPVEMPDPVETELKIDNPLEEPKIDPLLKESIEEVQVKSTEEPASPDDKPDSLESVQLESEPEKPSEIKRLEKELYFYKEIKEQQKSFSPGLFGFKKPPTEPAQLYLMIYGQQIIAPSSSAKKDYSYSIKEQESNYEQIELCFEAKQEEQRCPDELYFFEEALDNNKNYIHEPQGQLYLELYGDKTSKPITKNFETTTTSEQDSTFFEQLLLDFSTRAEDCSEEIIECGQNLADNNAIEPAKADKITHYNLSLLTESNSVTLNNFLHDTHHTHAQILIDTINKEKTIEIKVESDCSIELETLDTQHSNETVTEILVEEAIEQNNTDDEILSTTIETNQSEEAINNADLDNSSTMQANVENTENSIAKIVTDMSSSQIQDLQASSHKTSEDDELAAMFSYIADTAQESNEISSSFLEASGQSVLMSTDEHISSNTEENTDSTLNQESIIETQEYSMTKNGNGHSEAYASDSSGMQEISHDFQVESLGESDKEELARIFLEAEYQLQNCTESIEILVNPDFNGSKQEIVMLFGLALDYLDNPSMEENYVELETDTAKRAVENKELQATLAITEKKITAPILSLKNASLSKESDKPLSAALDTTIDIRKFIPSNIQLLKSSAIDFAICIFWSLAIFVFYARSYDPYYWALLSNSETISSADMMAIVCLAFPALLAGVTSYFLVFFAAFSSTFGMDYAGLKVAHQSGRLLDFKEHVLRSFVVACSAIFFGWFPLVFGRPAIHHYLTSSTLIADGNNQEDELDENLDLV